MKLVTWNRKWLALFVSIIVVIIIFACNPRTIDTSPTTAVNAAPVFITVAPDTTPTPVIPTPDTNATIQAIIATAISTALPANDKGMQIVIINDSEGVHIIANATPIAGVPSDATSTPPQATPTLSPTPTITPTPVEREHCVEEGETLFEIAQRYGVPVKALARRNNIWDINFVRIGQCLKIPNQPGQSPSPTLPTSLPDSTLPRPTIAMVEPLIPGGNEIYRIILTGAVPGAVDYKFEVSRDGITWEAINKEGTVPIFGIAPGPGHSYRYVQAKAVFNINGQIRESLPSTSYPLNQ